MTTDAIEYRTAPPPRLRHSALSVAALVISLFVPVMLAVGSLANVVFDGRPESYPPKVWFSQAWGGLIALTYLSFPIGLIAGVLGVMRRGYKRRLAVLACVINAAALALLLAWVLGLTGGR